jgi:prolyl-tRNA editing enzyme YbaK/EbsC (Cys-tRNA(Pro) deacylase)
MRHLASPSVRRVQAALEQAGSTARVVELTETARTAEDAARACGVPVGAIVKSLLFMLGDAPVMVLVAGDRRCLEKALPAVLGLEGKARRADADQVRAGTGFAIGGVAPVAHPNPLPVLVDPSLGRFERLFAAAGHPHCVFATTLPELLELTGGRLAEGIAG